ncbi:penicillin-binding protein 2 [Arachidicoccus ginsenosidimutans]|uniref:peptidoglycan D,D-transpeptidase FtsI family protein n=1 Tax=Arachidicoccus sp. BS20 TaxID=1850526 RepID=UPI0007F04CE0|nr:penicillin-binding transpeptidase domain-containing protein [Arachidicoccus sp. BS20]ANI89907.1 penicillin-binding protein 2 [Arachidicoccus sp. BS20]
MAIQNNNQVRSRIILGIFAVIFAVILVQLLNLQLFSSKYRIQAENNAILRKVVYPDRGIIYDRKGRAILDNVINYDLIVTPAEARKGVDTSALCNILGIDTAEYHKRIITAIIKNSSFKSSTFEPLLTPELYAQLNENMYKFPGFALQERPVRTYPYHAGANFLGREGEVSSKFLKDNPDAGYQPGDNIGITGLEKSYEKVLMGQRGVQRFLRDNRARIQGPYANGDFDTTAVAGRNLYTSIDIKVQALGEKMFQGKLGAAVAINPKTGGIIAMVTAPSFDPNDLSPSEYRKHIGFLVTDTSQPMYNRAVSGGYPPGSTYKPIGALIALDEGLITPKTEYDCSRPYSCGGKLVHNDENGSEHETLKPAIAHSYNSYFCHIFKLTLDNPAYNSPRKGYAVWQNYMHSFGFGRALGVDIPGEKQGNIPDTMVYNEAYGSRWVACNLITMGIGQDKMLLTPLQSANEACIIANKGWYYTPHFVDSIENQTEDDTVYLAKYHVKHQPLHISDEDYRSVQEGMEDVTEIGTAHNITIPGVRYAAKTGTAQVPKLKNLAVFIAYAPVDNPKIAMAVYVENAGYGATWAGPIAAHMMELYLNDTLTSETQADVERLSKADLFPSQIYEWRRRKDSFKAVRLREEARRIDSIALARKEDSLKMALANKNKKAPAKDSEHSSPAILSDKAKISSQSKSVKTNK